MYNGVMLKATYKYVMNIIQLFVRDGTQMEPFKGPFMHYSLSFEEGPLFGSMSWGE